MLSNLEPLFIPVITGVFFATSFDKRFWLGWLVTILGMSGVIFSEVSFNINNLLGDGLAVTASLMTTLFYLMKEELITYFPADKMLKWICITGSVVLLPLNLIESPQLFPHSLHAWLSAIGLGVFCQFIGHGLITYSLSKLSSGLVTLFLPLETIIAGLSSSIIFLERLSIVNYLSCLIVVVGVLIAAFSTSTLKSPIHSEVKGT